VAVSVDLRLGDCLELMKSIPDGSVDAVVTDPPYGMAWNTDHTRFVVGPNGNGHGRPSKQNNPTITGDDKPFDPVPFLKFDKVIMWGYHHYSSSLPEGSVLVWLKRLDGAFGTFLSDADLAWMKGGCGVYCFRDQSLYGQTKNKLHPTQKPLPLMKWCMEKVSNPGDTILDPFMGSGTTGVACVQTGRNFIGIEIDPDYYAIAERRIKEAQMQPTLFDA